VSRAWRTVAAPKQNPHLIAVLQRTLCAGKVDHVAKMAGGDRPLGQNGGRRQATCWYSLHGNWTWHKKTMKESRNRERKVVVEGGHVNYMPILNSTLSYYLYMWKNNSNKSLMSKFNKISSLFLFKKYYMKLEFQLFFLLYF